MMQILMFLTLIINSILFLSMNHPLSMGFILMIQTILISMFSGTLTFMFWFSYSLFLIFMGGMLILFMYMTSLASNEMFKFSLNLKKMFMISMLLMVTSVLMFYFIDFKNIMFINNLNNNETLSIMSIYNNMEKNNSLLSMMYNFPTNMITILLINYLFLTLIATVKITNIFKGPLRQKVF